MVKGSKKESRPSADNRLALVNAHLQEGKFRAVLFHDGPRTAVVLMPVEALHQLRFLRHVWNGIASGENGSLDSAMRHVRSNGWPCVELEYEKSSPRVCRVVEGGVEGADGGGDGAYDLFDVSGSPDAIGRAIAQSLAETDMMQGSTMMIRDGGQALYLTLKIKFYDPRTHSPDDTLCARCNHDKNAHTGMIDPETEELVEPYSHPCTECDCQTFAEPNQEESMANEPERKAPPSTFDHPFFANKPALKALKDNANPHPEHVRACLMELCRHEIRERENAVPVAEPVGAPSSAAEAAVPELQAWDFPKAHFVDSEDCQGGPVRYWRVFAQRATDGKVVAGCGVSAEQAMAQARENVEKFTREEEEKKRTAPLSLRRVTVEELIQKWNERPQGWTMARYLFRNHKGHWRVAWPSSRGGVLLESTANSEDWYGEDDLKGVEIYKLP